MFAEEETVSVDEVVEEELVVENSKDQELEAKLDEIEVETENSEVVETPLAKKDLMEEITVETKVIPSSQKIKEELCDDISNTYDISFVEEVLNNPNKQDKVSLINRWYNFPEIDGEEESKYLATLLETATVTASAYDKIIITFASTTICNTLMIPANKEIIMKIINKKFNRIINYMALPTSVFNEITREFMDRYRMGDKYIKLSKIVCEGLKDVSKVEKAATQDTKPQILQDAIELFGDKVKVKD